MLSSASCADYYNNAAEVNESEESTWSLVFGHRKNFRWVHFSPDRSEAGGGSAAFISLVAELLL